MSEDCISVSVITLTYKNYYNLFKTIKSVLNQNYTGFEYIISDDGSGDFPRQEVLNYVEKHKKENLKSFRLLVNEKNVGTVKHLNNVLKSCNGEYIFDLPCSDLFINENVISQILNTFNKENCDVLFVSRLSYKNNKIKSINPHYLDRKKISKLNTNSKMYSAHVKYEHYGMFIGPNMFYKKSLIEKFGYFDERYLLLEDAPMIEKILWTEKVCLRPDIISVIYESENGVSTKKVKNVKLKNDLRFFNHFGKLDHIEELDYWTRRHIKFGIDREESRNLFEFAFVCFMNLPRILGFIGYLIRERIIACGDMIILKRLNCNIDDIYLDD